MVDYSFSRGGIGNVPQCSRAGVPGNVVDRLDKGLHVGEETDPCTEIPGGSVAVSWPESFFKSRRSVALARRLDLK